MLSLYLLQIFWGKAPPRVVYTIRTLEYDLYWSTLLIFATVVLATAVTASAASLFKLSTNAVWQLSPIVLLCAVVGARIERVVAPPPHLSALGIEDANTFLESPYLLFDPNIGGFGFLGALVGGGLSLFWLGWRRNWSFLRLADLAVIGLALGQSLSVWRHFFDQGVYGRPTTLPWGVPIASTFRLPAYANFDTFHPMFLYDSLWMLGLFFILLFLLRQKEWRMRGGVMTAVYLLGFGFNRLLLDWLRLNLPTWTVGVVTLPTSTWLAFILLLVALVLLLWSLQRRV